MWDNRHSEGETRAERRRETMTEKQFRQLQKLIAIRAPFLDRAVEAKKAGNTDLVKQIYREMREAQIAAQQ